MSQAMTKDEREAFLAGLHVGVLTLSRKGRGPMVTPIGYAYEPGGAIRMVTGGSSIKAKLMREHGRASLLVQTETPPYQYVTVEGPIVLVGDPDFERDIRQMAIRYLGPDMAEMYLQMTAADREGNVLVELRPERWTSVDYTKMAE